MRLPLTIEILRRGNWYVARTPELDFISQGRTHDEAKTNLLEVMKIQIAEMKEMGTLEEYLVECGFGLNASDNIQYPEFVGFEKAVVTV